MQGRGQPSRLLLWKARGFVSLALLHPGQAAARRMFSFAGRRPLSASLQPAFTSLKGGAGGSCLASLQSRSHEDPNTPSAARPRLHPAGERTSSSGKGQLKNDSIAQSKQRDNHNRNAPALFPYNYRPAPPARAAAPQVPCEWPSLARAAPRWTQASLQRSPGHRQGPCCRESDETTP